MSENSYDRVPPHNLDAERAVLGACLLDREALLAVTDSLRGDDFYEPRYKMAFELMEEMVAKDKAVDSLTFQEELTKRSLSEKFGGYPFITSLIDAVTTTANIDHYVAIVRDKSIHRGLVRVGSEIVRMGYSEDIPFDEALENSEQKVYEIARTGGKNRLRSALDVVTSAFQQIEERLVQGAGISGVPSGYKDLDAITGGFQPGSLNILAARPSMGKTALALNIAQHAAVSENIPVLIFSLEMSAEQLAQRLLSADARVNIRALQQAGCVRADQWKDLTEAAGKLSRSPIFIDDSSVLSTQELRSRCRRFFAKHKNQLGLVVVDYLQLMESSKRTDSKVNEVSEISRSLKGVAREFNVPVIALSQLSREVEKRGGDKRPVLSDLRDSGAIEQDADLVAFLYRPAYYEQDQESADPTAELGIAKHRNGPTGRTELIFYREFARFENKIGHAYSH